MVVGNGLLAKTFEKYKNDDQVIIFASGVSNSKETNQEAFKREMDLLKSMKRDSLLVYFSTCSFYDWSARDTMYASHKYIMEGLVESLFEKNIIFRLPTVVGNTNNPHTFFNFFKNKIKHGKSLVLSPETTRYLIGADDLAHILPPMIDKYKLIEKVSKKINVAFNNKTEVLHIVSMMMQLIGNTSEISFDGFNSSYEIGNFEFNEYLGQIIYDVPENYTYNLLKKYLTQHE